MNISSNLKVLDLFSGIGGFSLGLEWAGSFETVAFCEIEKYPQEVLKKHWPGVPVYEEIRELTADRLVRDGIPKIDVITAGFPCQDVSVGHTWREAKGLEGERSGLWSEVVRIADEVRPLWIIAENVPALRVRGLAQLLQDLWSIRYDCEWHIISASLLGAVHKRERIFIVANPEGFRLQGLWPNGLEKSHLYEREILPVCSGDGEWEIEPDVCRENDGVSRRVDKLKALGNSVVPQIPMMIGKAILDFEHRGEKNE